MLPAHVERPAILPKPGLNLQEERAKIELLATSKDASNAIQSVLFGKLKSAARSSTRLRSLGFSCCALRRIIRLVLSQGVVTRCAPCITRGVTQRWRRDSMITKIDCSHSVNTSKKVWHLFPTPGLRLL